MHIDRNSGVLIIKEKFINNINLGWRLSDSIRRNVLKESFSKEGCSNYVTTKDNDDNRDVYWTDIHEDGTIKKIDVGGPRK